MPEVGGEFVVDGAHISAEAARKGETLKVRIEGAAGATSFGKRHRPRDPLLPGTGVARAADAIS
jgi:hypothetical protein